MFPFEVSLSSKSLDPYRAPERKYFFDCTSVENGDQIIARAEFNLLTSHTSGGSVFFLAFYAEKRKWTDLSKVYTHG